MPSVSSEMTIKVMTYGGRTVEVWGKKGLIENGNWTKTNIIINIGYKFKVSLILIPTKLSSRLFFFYSNVTDMGIYDLALRKELICDCFVTVSVYSILAAINTMHF